MFTKKEKNAYLIVNTEVPRVIRKDNLKEQRHSYKCGDFVTVIYCQLTVFEPLVYVIEKVSYLIKVSNN